MPTSARRRAGRKLLRTIVVPTRHIRRATVSDCTLQLFLVRDFGSCFFSFEDSEELAEIAREGLARLSVGAAKEPRQAQPETRPYIGLP